MSGLVFERVLTINQRNAFCLEFIKKNLKTECFGVKLSDVSIRNNIAKLKVSFVGNKNVGEQILIRNLNEIYTTIFKYQFFDRNIVTASLRPIKRKVLLSAILNFDAENDKKYIHSNLMTYINSKIISIDGIFNFRLQSLKQRWKEVCFLINQSASGFCYNDVFIDFIKFVQSGSKPKCEVIMVTKKSNNFDVKCDNAQINLDNQLVAFGLSEEEKLISVLLYFMPRCLIIEKVENLSYEYKSLIKELFS